MNVIEKRNNKTYNNLYYNVNERLSFEVLSKTVIFNKITKKIDFKDKNILEIGFGSGNLIKTILRKGGYYYGSEISESAIKSANNMYGSEIQVFKSKNTIPFPDNFFDIILMSHTLEHIRLENNIITECNRAMKKNGTIIIGVPSEFCEDNHLHHRAYTEKKLKSLAKKHKFNITNLFVFRKIPYLDKKNKMKTKDSARILSIIIKQIYYHLVSPILAQIYFLNLFNTNIEEYWIIMKKTTN